MPSVARSRSPIAAPTVPPTIAAVLCRLSDVEAPPPADELPEGADTTGKVVVELDKISHTKIEHALRLAGALETYPSDGVPVAGSEEMYQNRSSHNEVGGVSFKFVTTRVCTPGASVGEVKYVTLYSMTSGDAGGSSLTAYVAPSITNASDGHPYMLVFPLQPTTPTMIPVSESY